MHSNTLLVTGGAGFIGSALVRLLIRETDYTVVNIDKLTYAGNLQSLAEVTGHPRYIFAHHDICDRKAMDALFNIHQPCGVMHLAAESHVDRSIDKPAAFIDTNIVGTYTLLEAARAYWSPLPETQQTTFRFHHISTDEVFGDLRDTDALFAENSPYAPSSPYSASKAASDHLVKAWQRSYGLPTVISYCSNNYGSYQFPEKLIPLTIINALHGKPLPIYGDGKQIRDWLYVEDHVRALLTVFQRAPSGASYTIGGHNQQHNIEVVQAICALLDEIYPTTQSPATQHLSNYAELITHVPDRPGHDLRYAVDAGKIACELNWAPQETFSSGLRKTVQWYLANQDWWRAILDGVYQGERLGLGTVQ